MKRRFLSFFSKMLDLFLKQMPCMDLSGTEERKISGTDFFSCPIDIQYVHIDKLRMIISGVPWTEEEHRMFLMGLRRLGKGDWRGIARNFVVSRTPTQVASHAQKYFIRQSNSTRRKRRSSLFDMVPDLVRLPSILNVNSLILFFIERIWIGKCRL